MAQTTKTQKFVLFLLGLFLTLVILEIVLRLGGAIFNARLEAGNRFTADKGEIRILCLGDSTTALGFEDSHPSQLEQVLRARYPQKSIKVINRGMVNRSSWDMLERLESDLKKYKPQIVIGMIGVSDTKETPSFTVHRSAPEWFRELHVLHFFSLVSEQLARKFRGVRGGEHPPRGGLPKTTAPPANGVKGDNAGDRV
jgi:hypothetical protein